MIDRQNFSQVRDRVNQVMTTAPKAPTPAAAVEVNQPRSMPPMAMRNKITTSSTPSSERNRSCHDDFDPAGPSFGFIHAMTKAVINSRAATRSPGNNEA